MQNDNYITFEILGIKHNDGENSFSFDNDAIYELSNDKFIKKIVMSRDISNVTFYLKNSLQITDETLHNIINYLYLYLGSMMIGVLKSSIKYTNVSLSPVISISKKFINNENAVSLTVNEHIGISDSFSFQFKFGDGDGVLKQWIQNSSLSNYIDKNSQYDILFLLLQGKNKVQKYMAMYAYLMSLVREISSKPNESQKQVVQYVANNCSRVGIILHLTQSNRPGAKANDNEDRFTALRNKIGHPMKSNLNVNVSESDINGLAAIICCAIEDLPVSK